MQVWQKKIILHPILRTEGEPNHTPSQISFFAQGLFGHD